jgi:Xaa-Pro aminopeptidase
MSTKDKDEIERIRRMGQITTEVVGEVADYLCSHTTRDEMLVKPDGNALTIGDVKGHINLWLAMRGADNPEGTIFSSGHDAAVPHSTGTAASPVRMGQTLIFDIFPCESGGGYFYDFTRTWCLGYASDEAMALYENVLAVYQQITREMRPGGLSKDYQQRVCDLFEEQGHSTINSNPQTQSGYVHGLGHGVGLYIHERPHFNIKATDADRLDPGVVFTVEPGLYYPEKNMGVRLEDTYWMRPGGQLEVLAEFPLDLVLPIG